MEKVKVNEIILCLLVLLSGCNSSFLKSFDNELTADVTENPSIEFTATPDLPSAEPTTEENVTEAAQPDHRNRTDFEHIVKPSHPEVERNNSSVTQPIDRNNNSIFRLMMTVFAKWNDQFMEKTSSTFTTLANELGVELMDFIDNSQESNAINVTDFKLVEVLPSKDSSEKLYVTFVVTPSKEFAGEDLSNAISSRILNHGGIYEYKATIEGFVLEKITREEAQDYDETKAACDLGRIN